MFERTPRDVWLADCSPAPNVQSSDVVCGPSESAVATVETLSLSIGFRDEAAVWARAARVVWINDFDGNPRKLRLVGDELSELAERPRVLGATLGLSNRYPGAYALQVFEGDSPPGAFSLRNQPLRDSVVHVSGEAGFPPAALLEEAFRRLCSLALKLCSEFCVAFSESVQVLPTPGLSVGVYGYVSDSEVYAEPLLSVVRWWFWNVNDDGEVEDAVSEGEVCLSPDSVEPPRLVGAVLNGDDFPPLQGQYGHPVGSLPTEDALVVDYGSVLPEGWFDSLVPLVGFSHLADGSDGQLRGQAILAPNVVVDEFLEPYFVGCSVFKRNIGYFVAGFVERFHRFEEGFGLFGGGQKLHEESQFHIFIERINQYLNFSQPLPPINRRASCFNGDYSYHWESILQGWLDSSLG